MNEVQLIRRELAAQRRHARDIEASWSARLGDINTHNSEAYNSYFLFILGMESKRIQSHLERLRIRSDLSKAEHALLELCGGEFETLTAARAPSSPRSASASGSAATVTADTLARNVESLNRLSMLLQQLDAIAESRYGVEDWRSASHLDADSILEERRLRRRALGESHGPASA